MSINVKLMAKIGFWVLLVLIMLILFVIQGQRNDFGQGGRIRLKQQTSVAEDASKVKTCQSDLVCDEIYHGNHLSSPRYEWYEKAWTLDNNCSKRIDQLVTIVILQHDLVVIQEQIKDIRMSYKSMPILIGVQEHLEHQIDDKNVEVFKMTTNKEETFQWRELVQLAKTPFILIAYKMNKFPPNWSNLERLARLIGDKSTGVVSGATRNTTGHWRSHCWQTNMGFYNLVLTPGYISSYCDCMKCSIFWDNFGPFMATKTDLEDHLDAASFSSTQMMFADFFLKINHIGKSLVTCPDVMFSIGDDLLPPSDQEWLQLAKKWGLQGISKDLGPKKIHSFSCSEVGLKCEPARQTKSFIVPWCCVQSAMHIISTMDRIADIAGLHYELDSGSVLGAVKLHNFIPWDIDGDLYIPTEDMHHFHKNGTGRIILEEEGIVLHSWRDDNYSDKGAGHYQLTHGGLSFELMGKRGKLTLKEGMSPTRILVGSTWARVHHHPGQYLRGRYGPQYLQHAQSWQFLETMENACDNYGGHQWTQCENPGHHACLENYPSDGNVQFLPHRYP
jgi:hypothetical protein